MDKNLNIQKNCMMKIFLKTVFLQKNVKTYLKFGSYTIILKILLKKKFILKVVWMLIIILKKIGILD